MPPRDDLLFCKIAVMNGLVSEVDAKKVLALCEKRQREDGRRPLIGAVFTKYNLMKTREVEKVYDALRKRTGGGTSTVSKSALRASAVKSGVRGRPRRQTTTRVESKAVRQAKGIDPVTMWLGIGGLLVFIGIVLTIIYLVSSGGAHKKAEAPKEVASEKDKEAELEALRKLTAAPKTPPASEAKKKEREPVGDIPQAVKHDIMSFIADAKGMDPAQGVQHLEAKRESLIKEGWIPPQYLLDAIQQLREAAASEGGGAITPPPASPAPAPAEDTPAKDKSAGP